MRIISTVIQYILYQTYVQCIQIEFKLNENKLLTGPFCLQKDCYNFVFNTIESFSWLKEPTASMSIGDVINESFSSKLYNQAQCNQYVQTSNVLIPKYIYDEKLLQSNLHLSFPFFLIFTIPNCTILQPEAPISASIGFGKSIQSNSDLLRFYSSNYQLIDDMFSYQFLTDSIAKVYIGERSKFKYKSTCTPNLSKTNQLNCIYNYYTENIQPFDSRVNDSYGEVYFNSIRHGLYIREDYHHWSLLINHLIRLNCSYTKVKNWMNIICPIEIQNEFYLSFNDFEFSFKELFQGEVVNKKMRSNIFIDDRPGVIREITMGLNVIKYYHIEFNNNTIAFEKNTINKEWSVEVMTMFTGLVGVIAMLLYQIYKIDKSI